LYGACLQASRTPKFKYSRYSAPLWQLDTEIDLEVGRSRFTCLTSIAGQIIYLTRARAAGGAGGSDYTTGVKLQISEIRHKFSILSEYTLQVSTVDPPCFQN
jgi:hypothetical protein